MAVAASLVVLLLLAVVGIVVLLRTRAPHRRGPVPASTLAHVDVPDTPATRELLGRWRDRARRWRRVAMWPLLTFSIVASVRATGEVQFGLVNTAGVAPLWADPLVVGLLAVALGALAAELHHLRRRPDGPRSADLTPRDVGRLRRPRSRVRRVVLGLLLVASAVLHLFAADGQAGSPPALAVAAAVLLAGEVVERRIALRPRPALSADLVTADDAVRRAAVRSVDDAVSGAALLLLGWATLGLSGSAPPGALADGLTAIGSLGALGSAVWWAIRSAPRRLLPTAAGDHAAAGAGT